MTSPLAEQEHEINENFRMKIQTPFNNIEEHIIFVNTLISNILKESEEKRIKRATWKKGRMRSKESEEGERKKLLVS